MCESTKVFDHFLQFRLYSVCESTKARRVGDSTKQLSVCESTKEERSPLLLDRTEQGDFFVCDIFDAVPKGDMASMEHPVFSISTKPDRRLRRYENGDQFLEVIPSVNGLATVHDRDVLIFVISQIMAKVNRGERVERKARFKAYDMLKATNRPTDGRSYGRLKDALDRLTGTRIVTNIVTAGKQVTKGFGLVTAYEIVREIPFEGRMQEVEITLSDWVFNAIENNEVLTLNRNYFRLRKPLERRLYELARKHCGRQASWSIMLPALQNKVGSGSTLREFRRLVRKITEQDAEHSHMPDYAVSIKDDKVTFENRQLSDLGKRSLYTEILLSSDTYEEAKKVCPRWDIAIIETEWRQWMYSKGMKAPKNPDKAFLGFCRTWFKNHGQA